MADGNSAQLENNPSFLVSQKLVENDKKNRSTVISGTNIEEFLSTVEKDNQKWRSSLLEQVKK